MLGGGLGEGAAVGVVQAAVCFDVGDACTGILPRQMEHGGIGQRDAEGPEDEKAEEEAGAKPDGEAGHGWNLPGWVGKDKAGPGGEPGPAPVQSSACGPSWPLRPRRYSRP